MVLCSTPPSLRDPVPFSSSHACIAASGMVLLLVSCPYRHPARGVDGAPTGALLCYVARARRDDRVSETRAVPLQPGRPLGAPSWRFSAGDPCAAASGSGTGADEHLPASSPTA